MLKKIKKKVISLLQLSSFCGIIYINMRAENFLFRAYDRQNGHCRGCFELKSREIGTMHA